MLCEQCGRREATEYFQVRNLGPPGRQLCHECWVDVEGRAAAEDARAIAAMAVDYEAVRAQLREAEARGTPEDTRHMAEGLRHVLRRYGRVLPPDIAEWMELHLPGPRPST